MREGFETVAFLRVIAGMAFKIRLVHLHALLQRVPLCHVFVAALLTALILPVGPVSGRPDGILNPGPTLRDFRPIVLQSDSVARCVRPMVDRGAWGDVVVLVSAGSSDAPKLKITLPRGWPTRLEACIRQAVMGDPQIGESRNTGRVHVYPVGDPQPLWPDAARLLPAWHRATSGQDSEPVRQLLDQANSHGEIGEEGCLIFSPYIEGSNTAKAAETWLRQQTHAVHPMVMGPVRSWYKLGWLRWARVIGDGAWTDAFFVYVVFRWGGDNTSVPNGKMCLHPLVRKGEEGFSAFPGRCWEEDSVRRLTNPRVSFPESTTAVAIYTDGRDLACALDGQGRAECCGRGSDDIWPAPESRWKSLALNYNGGCGIGRDGKVDCFGVYLPLPDEHIRRERTLPVGGPYMCAFGSQSTWCWSGKDSTLSLGVQTSIFGKANPTFVTTTGKAYRFSRNTPTLDPMSPEGGCWLERNGSATCWQYRNDFLVKGHKRRKLPGFFRSIVRGNGFACGLRPEGKLACYDLHFDHATSEPDPGRFSAIAAADDVVCAIGLDANLSCWRTQDAQHWQGTAAPKGNFSFIDARQSTLCGVRTDGQPGCWSWNPMSVFWDPALGGKPAVADLPGPPTLHLGRNRSRRR
jgi:hypothetical protein